MTISTLYPSTMPTLSLNFLNSTTLDPRITFTRTSIGTYFDSDGILRTAADSVPRFDYDPTVFTQQNLLTYSEEFNNAAWGKTNSSITANTTIAPDGSTNGDTLLINAAGGAINQTSQSFAAGSTITVSVYAKKNASNFLRFELGNLVNCWFNLDTGATATNGAGSGNVLFSAKSIQSVGNGWYRCALTVTTSTITTLDILIFATNADNTTSAINSSVFIWGAQLNTGSTALPYLATTATAQTIYAPTPRGLLIEEQRTNSIRNNTMQGAVAPSTFPTNWQSVIVSGITSTVIGTGTQNGIAYLDVRVSGTPSVSSFYNLVPDILVAGASGQTWTGSFWASLIAGSLTNTNANIEIRESDASQAFLTNTLTAIPINSTLTRYAQARTLNNASTAFVSVRFVWQITSGLPVDFTLRIGLPQLEQGAFATSVIPTTTAAATRLADSAVMTGSNFSPWYNATEGTLFAEAQRAASSTSTAFPRIASINDNTANNEIAALWATSINKLYGVVVAAGATQADIGYSGQSQSAVQKTALAYKANDFAFTANAQTVQVDTAGTVPVVNRLSIGNIAASSEFNGHIRRIVYYPTRLPNAQLQALTTS